MKKFVALFSITCLVVVCLSVTADARPQYKGAFEKNQFVPETDAEKALGEKIKADSCNACHIKDQPKKQRNEYGEKLMKTLPKYEKDLWENNLDTAIKGLRDGINKVQ